MPRICTRTVHHRLHPPSPPRAKPTGSIASLMASAPKSVAFFFLLPCDHIALTDRLASRRSGRIRPRMPPLAPRSPNAPLLSPKQTPGRRARPPPTSTVQGASSARPAVKASPSRTKPLVASPSSTGTRTVTHGTPAPIPYLSSRNVISLSYSFSMQPERVREYRRPACVGGAKHDS